MPISSAIKTSLNSRLHNEVLGLTGDSIDYTDSKTAMQPILDELAKDGWVMTTWADEKMTVSTTWINAKVISLKRQIKVTLTRKNKSTYPSTQSTEYFEVIGNMCSAFNPKIILDEKPVALALSALMAKAKGPRPANWLVDIEVRKSVYALGLCKINTDGSVKEDWFQTSWMTGDTIGRRQQLESFRTANPGVYQPIHEFATLADYDVKEKLIYQAARDAK